jgi:hypothetical protein
MKLAVTVVSPPGYPHAAAFREIAETLQHALTSLGHDVVITTEGRVPERRHIVLGSNLLVRYPLAIADDAILYNLEQVQADSPWFEAGLLDLFRRYDLWDYSRRNVAALQALGIERVRLVPIGYAPELTRIAPAAVRDIDVLFFGSVNDRRRAVLERMVAEGLRVHGVFGAYGEERDALIARAKIVLNVHFYDARVLEMVRLSYLLANRAVVLSERGADPEEDAALAGGVAFDEYDRLPQRARQLVDSPEERRRLSRRGFELISARPAAEYLRAALEDR